MAFNAFFSDGVLQTTFADCLEGIARLDLQVWSFSMLRVRVLGDSGTECHGCLVESTIEGLRQYFAFV